MIKVCEVTDLVEGEGTRVERPPWAQDAVAVFKVGDEFLAIDDTCTHQDASLADGWVENCVVECPLHASCFDLRTGEPTGPPAKAGVRTHPIEIHDGVVYLIDPSEHPSQPS